MFFSFQATNGNIVFMDPRMNKCLDSLNAFLMTTQQVVRIVLFLPPLAHQGNYVVSLGIDYVSKKSLGVPNSIIKVFDARTLDILPYSHRFQPSITSLRVVDEPSDSFLVSDLHGDCAFYSLLNGLVETQQYQVPLPALSHPAPQRRRRNGLLRRPLLHASTSRGRFTHGGDSSCRQLHRRSCNARDSLSCRPTSIPPSSRGRVAALFCRCRWTPRGWGVSSPSTRLQMRHRSHVRRRWIRFRTR